MVTGCKGGLLFIGRGRTLLLALRDAVLQFQDLLAYNGRVDDVTQALRWFTGECGELWAYLSLRHLTAVPYYVPPGGERFWAPR